MLVLAAAAWTHPLEAGMVVGIWLAVVVGGVHMGEVEEGVYISPDLWSHLLGVCELPLPTVQPMGWSSPP